MKLRTIQRVPPERQPEQHHNACVMLLDPAVRRIRNAGPVMSTANAEPKWPSGSSAVLNPFTLALRSFQSFGR
jgi:hypothetical protein